MHIKRYQSWILAGISGILLILSFPSFNLFPIGWISLIPLLIALQSTSNWKSAFLHSYVTGASILSWTDLLDHPALSLRKHLLDHTRLFATWQAISQCTLAFFLRCYMDSRGNPVCLSSSLCLQFGWDWSGCEVGS